MIELNLEIELLREKLNNQISEKDSLLNDETYEASKKLDELIVKYYEIKNTEKYKVKKIESG